MRAKRATTVGQMSKLDMKGSNSTGLVKITKVCQIMKGFQSVNDLSRRFVKIKRVCQDCLVKL